MVAVIFFAGGNGGRFGFRFKIFPRARCALRLGAGPRVLGFSMSAGKLKQEIVKPSNNFRSGGKRSG
jgi:hypothetical protein